MNITLGNLSTANSYMKTNATKRMAVDVAQNQVERKTDDFEKMLDSTSTSGCSCCGSDGYESSFDVSI